MMLPAAAHFGEPLFFARFDLMNWKLCFYPIHSYASRSDLKQTVSYRGTFRSPILKSGYFLVCSRCRCEP